jgi:hypothetical protein
MRSIWIREFLPARIPDDCEIFKSAHETVLTEKAIASDPQRRCRPSTSIELGQSFENKAEQA